MKVKRTIIALILIIALSATAGQALAAESGVRHLPSTADSGGQKLTLITGITPGLRVSGSTATYDLIVTCISSVNSITATLQLQQYKNGSWSNYGSPWNAYSSKSYLTTSGTKTVASGYTYRLKVDVTASNGSETGNATVYS